MSGIPTDPSSLNSLLTVVFILTLPWAWVEIYEYTVGDKTLTTPATCFGLLVMWLTLLGFDIWLILSEASVTVTMAELVVIGHWIVVNLLKFGTADRETLGIPESL